MIGNKEWFTTYTPNGRGLWPVCWQGWAYLAVAVAGYVILRFPARSWLDDRTLAITLAYAWLVVFMVDMLIIRVSLKGR